MPDLLHAPSASLPPACHALRMAPRLALVLTVVLGLCASSARAATRVAMMPLVAESLLPAARDDLEGRLLSELAALGHDVLPMRDTRAQIEEGVRTGLDCTLLEDDCAVRVGLVADVDVVVLTSVEVYARALVLRAAWLDVQSRQGRRVVGSFNLPAADDGASLRNLVNLLVSGQGTPTAIPVELELDPPTATLEVDGRPGTPGTAWLLPGAHALRARAPGRTTVELRLDVPLEGLPAPVALALPVVPPERSFPVGVAAGVGLGLTGGVVALGGGAAALAIDAGLREVMARDERNAQQSYGRAAVLVSGVAAALALGGVGLSLALEPAHAIEDGGGSAVPP